MVISMDASPKLLKIASIKRWQTGLKRILHDARYVNCLLLFALAPLSARSIDAGFSIPMSNKWQQVQSRHSAQFYFNWDNDAFLVGTISDRFYTNGLRGNYERHSDDLFWQDNFGYLTPLQCDDSDGVIKLNECQNFKGNQYNRLSPKTILNKTYRINTGYFLSQHMYTPSDIRWQRDELSRFERPYAGWLQIGFSTSQTNVHGYETLEWAIGCVGPCSAADIAQDNIHRNLGDQLPKGWDTQIKNAPTLQLKYERSLSLLRLPFGKGDLVRTYLTLDAGNILTRLGVGGRLEIPLGFGGTGFNVNSLNYDACEKAINLQPQQPGTSATLLNQDQIEKLTEFLELSELDQPDVKDNLPENTVAQIHSNTDHGNVIPKLVKQLEQCESFIYTANHSITAHELRFYFELNGHFVAYNGLLQGPLGYDNQQQDMTTGHKPLIGSAAVGFKIQVNRFSIDGSYHTRSTESDGEALAFAEHSWMRLTISTPDATGLIGIPVSLGLMWGISRSGL